MLSVAEARAKVLDAIGPLDLEEVLIGNSLGRAVGRDFFAPHALPRFDNSAMDGYAVVGADVAAASEQDPVWLEVLGEVRAGEPGTVSVRSGGAARIMTGAPLPPGADAVVPVEDTEEHGGAVSVKAPPPPGRHVRPAGDDLKEGDLLVTAGTELGPGEMALLASVGMSPIEVYRVPKVAVVVTGDELVPPEASPGPGQIRDSNGVALRSLVVEAGGDPAAFEPVTDDRDSVVDTLRRAGKIADLVVSSGGVAVGKYDFVKSAVEELGGIELWRVAMQPGRPVVLGRIGATPFLGLPGNPVSIHVGFEQFVRPAIRKLRGCRELLRPVITATLTQRLEKRPGRLHFVRVRLGLQSSGWTATPTGPQGSHIQSSLIGCHGVARFTPDLDRLEAGSDVEVEVWRLPGGP